MKKIILSLIVASFILNGCIIVKRSTRIYTNVDPVHHALRHHVTFFFLNGIEWPSQVNTLKKSVLKIVAKKSQKVDYMVYDQLYLDASSGPVKDSVFIMVDGQIFPKKLKGLTLINRSEVNTSSNQVMTSDSTVVNVVSGVQTHYWNEASFHYSISPILANTMRYANDIRFIYYIGPHIFTVKFTRSQLNKLRKLIETSLPQSIADTGHQF